jgi:hypothetical protein
MSQVARVGQAALWVALAFDLGCGNSGSSGTSPSDDSGKSAQPAPGTPRRARTGSKRLCTNQGGGHDPGDAHLGWAMLKAHPMP